MLLLIPTLTFAFGLVLGPPQSSDVIFKDDVKQYIAKGDKTEDVDASLTFTADALVVASKRGTVQIPLTAITGGTYDRRARQRKVLGLPSSGYSPRLQHFLTVQYKTDTGNDFVELELGKDIAGRVVATLEAKSGKTIEKITG